jgi:hypothetical protein
LITWPSIYKPVRLLAQALEHAALGEQRSWHDVQDAMWTSMGARAFSSSLPKVNAVNFSTLGWGTAIGLLRGKGNEARSNL